MAGKKDEYALTHAAELSKITYASAIKHYRDLRKRFMIDYNLGSQKGNKIVANELMTAIIQDIERQPISEQRSKIFGTVTTELEKSVRTFFDGLDSNTQAKITNNILSLEKMTKKEKSKAKQNFMVEIDKINNQLFNNDIIEAELQEVLKDTLIEDSYDLQDLSSRAITLKREMLINIVQGKKANNDLYFQQTIAAGYLRESVVAGSFAKKFAEVGKSIQAQQTGSTPIKKIVKGKAYTVDSSVDVLIGNVENIKNTLQSFEKSTFYTDTIDNKIAVGIQTKSWTSDNGKSYNLSIGSRQNLLDKLDKHADWMKGVQLLAKKQNTLEALGPNNVAWVTGDKFYFTDDFIKFYREKNYFLNFIFNKKGEISPKIRWQMISKRYF